MGEGVRVTVDRGTVVLVELDPTVGHEQRGLRPCVAVEAPSAEVEGGDLGRKRGGVAGG